MSEVEWLAVYVKHGKGTRFSEALGISNRINLVNNYTHIVIEILGSYTCTCMYIPGEIVIKIPRRMTGAAYQVSLACGGGLLCTSARRRRSRTCLAVGLLAGSLPKQSSTRSEIACGQSSGTRMLRPPPRRAMRSPVMTSFITSPIEYMSPGGPVRWPMMTSGAAWVSVPCRTACNRQTSHTVSENKGGEPQRIPASRKDVWLT